MSLLYVARSFYVAMLPHQTKDCAQTGEWYFSASLIFRAKHVG